MFIISGLDIIGSVERILLRGVVIMKRIFTTGLILLLVVIGSAGAVERTLEISDREIVERLTRLEEGQKGLNEKIDNVRDELRGDIGELGDRIDDLRGLIYVALAGIIALIGFVIWDRRTAIAPVVRENRELAEREKRLENVLKEYARKEPRLLETLKSFGIL